MTSVEHGPMSSEFPFDLTLSGDIHLSNSSQLLRLMFGFAAIITAAALLLHFLNWQKQARMDWAAFFNMFGLFVLALTGALDLPSRRWRAILSALALGLIFPSAFLLLTR